MKILMIAAHYRHPGGETVSARADAEAVRALGHTVDLLEYPPLPPGLTGHLAALWNRDAARRVAEALKENPYDLIHIQSFFPAASIAVPLTALSSGVPVIVHLRNTRFLCPAGTLWREDHPCRDCGKTAWPGVIRGCWRDSRSVTALSAMIHRMPFWRRVTAFVATSDFLRRTLSPVLPPRPLFVVPNIVFPPPSDPSDTPRTGVLYAGRNAPEKGIDLLRAAANQAGLPLRLLTGKPWLSPAEVRTEMVRAAVVAVPSLWPEPFGRSALEGMASGAAVVASQVGGLPEVVGSAGLLVPPGDIGAWSNALRQAHDHHRELGPLGVQRVRDHFSSAEPLVEVYRAVLTTQATAKNRKRGTTRR